MRTLNMTGLLIIAFSCGFMTVGVMTGLWPKSSVGELSLTDTAVVAFCGCNAGIVAALLFVAAVAKMK